MGGTGSIVEDLNSFPKIHKAGKAHEIRGWS
jgi:hypothetical protein